MKQIISVKTHRRNEMIDITRDIAQAVTESGITNGVVTVFCPHTTAGITINENADPDVVHDVLLTLNELFPQHRAGYLHAEGNSDAHVKSSLMGCSEQVIVEEGRLALGTWQSIYFCEFDGPRNRKCWIQMTGA